MSLKGFTFTIHRVNLFTGFLFFNATAVRSRAVKKFVLPAALFLMLSTSCANIVQVKIDVVDQRTALENQALGTYQEMKGDLLLLASARSIDASGKLVPVPPIPSAKREAMRAMQRSEFNRDDIERLKSQGVFGEGKDGYLAFVREPEGGADSKSAGFAVNLLAEENADRKLIYARIAELNENFREGDVSRVETVMAGLNRDAAKEGEWIQQDNGDWTRKAKRK